MCAQRLAILNTGLDDALQFAGCVVIGFEGWLCAPVYAKGVFSLKLLFVSLMPPRFECVCALKKLRPCPLAMTWFLYFLQ